MKTTENTVFPDTPVQLNTITNLWEAFSDTVINSQRLHPCTNSYHCLYRHILIQLRKLK